MFNSSIIDLSSSLKKNSEIKKPTKAPTSEKKEKFWTVKECYFEIDNLRNKYSEENDEEKFEEYFAGSKEKEKRLNLVKNISA